MQQPPNYPNYGDWQQPNTQYPPQQWQSSPPNTYYPNQQPQTPPPGYPPQQPFQQPPMPPSFQTPPPKPPKKKRKTWLIVLAVIAVIIIIAAAASNGGGKSSSSQTQATTVTQAGTTPQPTDTPAPTAKPTQPPKWTTVQSFSGNGTKKTGVFTAPDDWKILYSCNGIVAGTAIDGILGVSVYGSDNTPIDPGAVNATCASGSKLTTGETEEHQGGQVYLSVDGTGDWTIQIQELK